MLVPYNMPSGEDAVIRRGLSAVGAEHLANPDDMPMIALLFYWVMATLLIGVRHSLQTSPATIRPRKPPRGQQPNGATSELFFLTAQRLHAASRPFYRRSSDTQMMI